MNNSTIVALQVLITAQVFLLGLAASQFSSDVVGRLRSQLDALRAEIQGAAIDRDEGVDISRLRRLAMSIGRDLDFINKDFLPPSLRVQFFVSITVLCVVLFLLTASAISLRFSVWGNFLDQRYAGGYGIAFAATVGPFSVLAQTWISRRFLKNARDEILCFVFDFPEVRLSVVSGIAEPSDRQKNK